MALPATLILGNTDDQRRNEPALTQFSVGPYRSRMSAGARRGVIGKGAALVEVQPIRMIVCGYAQPSSTAARTVRRSAGSRAARSADTWRGRCSWRSAISHWSPHRPAATTSDRRRTCPARVVSPRRVRSSGPAAPARRKFWPEHRRRSAGAGRCGRVHHPRHCDDRSRQPARVGRPDRRHGLQLVALRIAALPHHHTMPGRTLGHQRDVPVRDRQRRRSVRRLMIAEDSSTSSGVVRCPTSSTVARWSGSARSGSRCTIVAHPSAANATRR